MRDQEIENEYVLMPMAAKRAISVNLFNKNLLHRQLGAVPLTLFVEIIVVISNVSGMIRNRISRNAHQLVPVARSTTLIPRRSFNLERGACDAKHEVAGEAPRCIGRGIGDLPACWVGVRGQERRRDQRAGGNWRGFHRSCDVGFFHGSNDHVPEVWSRNLKSARYLYEEREALVTMNCVDLTVD